MPISAALLPEFTHEMSGTRKTLERIPEDKLDWQPHPKSMTLGKLATHLAELAGFVARALESNSFDIRPGGVPAARPALTSRAEILERFDANVAAGTAAIERTSDEQWMEHWTLLANGQTMFSLPRTAVVRTSAMNHSIHHRAQLTVYLRLLGVAVPALYGPSADE